MGRGVNSGVRLSYVPLLSKARGLQEGFKEPQLHHKAPRERGLPSRGQRREGGVATLIRIHFQLGPWNSFVPVTGLCYPLALIPACLTPRNTERGR